MDLCNFLQKGSAGIIIWKEYCETQNVLVCENYLILTEIFFLRDVFLQYEPPSNKCHTFNTKNFE